MRLNDRTEFQRKFALNHIKKPAIKSKWWLYRWFLIALNVTLIYHFFYPLSDTLQISLRVAVYFSYTFDLTFMLLTIFVGGLEIYAIYNTINLSPYTADAKVVYHHMKERLACEYTDWGTKAQRFIFLVNRIIFIVFLFLTGFTFVAIFNIINRIVIQLWWMWTHSSNHFYVTTLTPMKVQILESEEDYLMKPSIN